MKVCKVNVSGLRRTKNDIIVEQVKKVLQAKTLEEVYYHNIIINI